MAGKMIAVPPVGTRKRVPKAAIDQVVEQIAQKFKPRKMILFGSHAYGTPKTTSDVDLLIVMETSLPGAQQAVQILHAIDLNFGLDLVVYTPERLEQRLAWGDSFLHEVVTKGKVVYESADR
jgi:uncharacterized protein